MFLLGGCLPWNQNASQPTRSLDRLAIKLQSTRSLVVQTREFIEEILQAQSFLIHALREIGHQPGIIRRAFIQGMDRGAECAEWSAQFMDDIRQQLAARGFEAV